MNILYTCDDRYMWIMGTSVISLFENNKNMEKLTVYLLGDNISEENKMNLNRISDMYSREIFIIDIQKIEIPDTLITQRWPKSAFIRLFSSDILPRNVDKILYLDCDTIIAKEIAIIEKINMGDFLIYGVKDCIGSHYKKNIGLCKDEVYINAGVLLMNIKKLREIDIKERLNDYIDKYKNLISYADQDVLNGVFSGNIGVLNPCFNIMTIDLIYSYDDIMKLRKPTNFYSEYEFKQAKESASVIHYTSNMSVIRPWFSNSNHPQTEIFRKYLSLSPWRNEPLKEFVCNSKELRCISFVEKLPKRFSFEILGILHSTIRPFCKRIKAK